MPHFIPPLTSDDQKTARAMSGEDGIIEKIFTALPPTAKAFVEIGIGLNAAEFAKGRRVLQGNTVALKEQGWRGWWFDGIALPDFPVIPVFVNALNINSLWREHAIPAEPDLFSLDIDGQDFWVWMALNATPRVVVVEANSHFDPDDAKTVAWDPAPAHLWQGDTYYGASLAAMTKLARDKGYLLVYWNGSNAFYIRRDLVANPEDFAYEKLAFRSDFHRPHPPERVWLEV
jgi:hypothetical protein